MGDFQLQGINHLALVCEDMAQTVDFYSHVLGLRLVKTLELPNGGSQHCFFDIGNGDALAFFWFPDTPAASPGVTSVDSRALQTGQIEIAHGSMNPVAFNVDADQLADYRDRLEAKGIPTTPVLHHADVPEGFVPEADETTFLSSFYFMDPNGILLEFAATVRELGDPERDLQHAPARGSS